MELQDVVLNSTRCLLITDLYKIYTFLYVYLYINYLNELISGANFSLYYKKKIFYLLNPIILGNFYKLAFMIDHIL